MRGFSIKSVQIDGVTIKWLGHSGFLLEGAGKKIYIDPYMLSEEPDFEDKADILLITHDHLGHCRPADIRGVRRSDSTTLIPEKCSLNFRGDARRICEGDILAEGLAIKGIRIEVVPAYTPKKPYHPRGKGVGYIVELGGLRIYHAGDTDFTPEMRKLRVDVALLPIGGGSTMNEEEAALAAGTFAPRVVIPMHYGGLKNKLADPEKFKALVQKRNPKIEVIILEN
ncbi:MAG: MBL fold metallo-hydrolase [Methanosarcinaceae archaeon]|nr:MBL fold metallo-hydrolase [Methanosarcinaceae archaeon]MDD4331425.1 MBL fold metallo-hydrolase [Methanosarcinaceae archaeon]MDD4748830.1 MBL fold metallo-hydrolase [Methanosarcinaceae archaeon]